MRRFGSVRNIFLVVLSFVSPSCFAYFQPDEANLNPAGFGTADTLKFGELLFAPQGWIGLGAGNKLSVVWDWMAATDTSPAGYIRYRFGNPNVALAIESYVNYHPKQVDVQRPQFIVGQRDSQSWLRLNFSGKLSDSMRLHAFVGETLDQYQRYSPNGGNDFEEKLLQNDYTFDYGFAYEWTATQAIKFHVNWSAGDNFLLFKQIPHKKMLVAGVQFIPFPAQVLPFLSKIRIELNMMYVWMPIANYQGPTYFAPVIYWQWMGI